MKLVSIAKTLSALTQEALIDQMVCDAQPMMN
jgi:hypothetical protein